MTKETFAKQNGLTAYEEAIINKKNLLIYVSVITITATWTVGHRLRSAPTNGHRFTALSLPWREPIHVLTWLDVT